MSKISSENLFMLIKGMSKREQSGFKTTAGATRPRPPASSGEACGDEVGRRGTDKLYVRMFEAIARQKNHDEHAVIHDLKGFGSIKQFPRMKHYLFGLLLKHLSESHKGKSSGSRLREMTDTAEMLFNKSLYPLCRKILITARETAAYHENHLGLLEIIDWERKVMEAELHPGIGEKQLQKRLEDVTEYLEKIKAMWKYRHIAARYFLLERRQGVMARKHSESARLKRTVFSRYFCEANATSYNAKLTYFNTMSRYFQKTGDLQKSYQYNKRILQIMQELPGSRFREEMHNYIAILNNFLITLTYLRKNDEFLINIRKLKNLSSESEETRMRIFTRSCLLESDWYILTGKFEEAVRLIPVMQDGLSRFGRKIDREYNLLFLYNIAYIFFGNNNYGESLKYINMLLNQERGEIRPDIYAFSKFLYLINHYELGNEDLLEYAIRSAYRFLHQKRKLYKLESSVLKFIRNTLPHVRNRQELFASFTYLRNELKAIASDPFESRALDYFNFIAWLESKITGVSFAEIVRRKAMLIIKS